MEIVKSTSLLHEQNTPNSLKKKDIYLSNLKIHESYPLLFQVSFHDEKQFKDYVNLAKNQKASLDCVYQSLFSLGLRDAEKSKKESHYINKFGKSGVMYPELGKFIGNTFGIDVNNIYDMYFNTLVKKNVTSFLYNTLNDNHATLLMLSFKDYRGVPIQGTHCIVAYRYKNNIFFLTHNVKDSMRSSDKPSPSMENLIAYYL